MAGDQGLGWLGQLTKVREQVLEQEKRRETERRLERERNEESLAKKLKEDTPEALKGRFEAIRQRFDHEARKFYPQPKLEDIGQELTGLKELLAFYEDCFKGFGKVFTPAHKTVIPALLREIEDLQHGLERQLGQWREIKTAVDGLVFRARQTSDDAALVAAAKGFSDRAHKVPLSIPGDYFSREGDTFWVAELNGAVIGYVKYFAADKTVNFALAPDPKVNFIKFVRAALAKFATQGPLSEPLAAIRVRVGFVREVKFFTDMGFVRAEMKGPGEWVYQREVA